MMEISEMKVKVKSAVASLEKAYIYLHMGVLTEARKEIVAAIRELTLVNDHIKKRIRKPKPPEADTSKLDKELKDLIDWPKGR